MLSSKRDRRSLTATDANLTTAKPTNSFEAIPRTSKPRAPGLIGEPVAYDAAGPKQQ